MWDIWNKGDVRCRQTLGRLRSINPNIINHHQNLQNETPPHCFCRAKQISQWEFLMNHKFGDSSLNGWKVILRQTQKGVNFDMKLNGQSTPTIMEILTTPGTKLVIIAWRGHKLSRGLARGWHTHGHTQRRMQATAYPKAETKKCNYLSTPALKLPMLVKGVRGQECSWIWQTSLKD